MARERVLDINPDCAVEARIQFVDGENVAGLMEERFDVVVDAIDGVNSKVNLIVGLSAFFGLALGTLAAIVAEFIARRIRGHEDLAYAAGVPVLVTVGAATPSTLRLRIQKLLGRRNPSDGEGEPQAI